MSRRLVFWCGRTAEAWAPPTLNRTGLGGSETAVVEVARRFAADGWRVDVYGTPEADEGEHEDVGYWDAARLGEDERADVLVAWRQPAAHELPVRTRARVLWLHDHNGGPGWAEHLGRWDRVLGVSRYHRDFLVEAYGLPEDLVDYVPNGVNLSRFDPTTRKEPFSAVYANSPDRGLLTLLDLWPKIIGQETGAKLTVAYGFATMDHWIDAGRHDLQDFKDLCLRRMEQTPQVEYVGRLAQDALAKLYDRSVIWAYPSDFTETNCISAAEAMAGGCIPVCSSVGALKETVGEGGLVVWGPNRTRSNPYSPAWKEFFVRCAQGVLFERTNRLVLEARARQRAKALTWDAAFERWRRVVGDLLVGQVTPDLPVEDLSDERAGDLVAAG